MSLLFAACQPPSPEPRGVSMQTVSSRVDGDADARSESSILQATPESAAEPAKKGAERLAAEPAESPAPLLIQPSEVGGSAARASVVAPRAVAPAAPASGAARDAFGELSTSASTSPSPSVAVGSVTARKSAVSQQLAPRESDQEAYAARTDAGFTSVLDSPLSTFSIDVDTASYANVRRFLSRGQLPPPGAVRVEELINYFPYAYAEPEGEEPFGVSTEVSVAPWNPQHRLLHVGVQGRRLRVSQLPPRNMVFLIDVSGSMESPNKLPLLVRSLATLTETLTERDQVAMVVYAGASGLVLPPTSGDHKAEISAALARLQAGGSTNGGAGIELAYSIASRLARPGSTTRVILATDGDFNVGSTSEDELVRLIAERRKTGVFLSVLGFGMGNYKDSTLEALADNGNGNYAYVDSLAEARKVLVAEGGATLVTIAQDVKLQLEFNPAVVGSYRLIGYENRRLEAREFNDDQRDAGELGAGHAVTALYELIPPELAPQKSAVDPTRYQSAPVLVPGHPGELCTIKLRYKQPGAERSRKIERVVRDTTTPLGATSPAFRFAAAVASFGMTLRSMPERGAASYELSRELARGALGQDTAGYQHEFLGLVDAAAALSSAPRPLAMP